MKINILMQEQVKEFNFKKKIKWENIKTNFADQWNG